MYPQWDTTLGLGTELLPTRPLQHNCIVLWLVFTTIFTIKVGSNYPTTSLRIVTPKKVKASIIQPNNGSETIPQIKTRILFLYMKV